MEPKKYIQDRLEYLRGEIEAERISYEELAELQRLAEYIEPGDVVLLEWAGVPEYEKTCPVCGAWTTLEVPSMHCTPL